MRITTNIIRAIVGILFILSGLIKANDPLGLSYKMEEFFEVWNAGLANSHFFLAALLINLFDFLHAHSLGLSLVMITLEVMAGIALLLGWQKRFILYLLLVLIIFFTFLTGYAYASGKFKNCGCFGDCLPITPLTSFIKDLILLGMISWLLLYRQFIQPLGKRVLQVSIICSFLLLCIALQWYVLNYLPLKDCLPFRAGNNIQEGMKIPANAIQDSFAIRFVYQKDGRQYEFSPAGLPSDLSQYKFINRTDKLIRKGNAEPAIKAFSLINLSNEDETLGLLNDNNYALWYFINPDSKSMVQWQENKNLVEKAKQKGVPVYLITTNGDEVSNQIKGFPVYKTDVTIFRTAARTNPCLLLVKGGTIIQKNSGKSAEKMIGTVEKLPAQTAVHANLDHSIQKL